MMSEGKAKKETPQSQFPMGKKTRRTQAKMVKSIFSEFWKLIRSLQQSQVDALTKEVQLNRIMNGELWAHLTS